MDTFTITVYCTSCHHLDTLLTGQSSFGPIGVQTLLEIQMKLGVGGSRRLRDWSLITGRGGLQKGRGGHMKFYPYKKGGRKKF